jgi:hypothetical protein
VGDDTGGGTEGRGDEVGGVATKCSYSCTKNSVFFFMIAPSIATHTRNAMLIIIRVIRFAIVYRYTTIIFTHPDIRIPRDLIDKNGVRRAYIRS